MASQDLPKPDYAHRMKLIGHSDQGGRPDGVQLMVNKGHAFVGHMFSQGFSVIDCTDPRNPKPVNYIPAPPNTWNIHLQTSGDLLLVINAKDMFRAAEFQDEKAYYKGALGEKVGTAKQTGPATRDWTAGMAVYDIKDPRNPRQIGFLPVEGGGVHRIWYTGGRWAYVSVLLDGFSDYIFMTVDLADPANPKAGGKLWLDGMNTAAGEKPGWPPTKRFGLHHATVSGDLAFASWRDAGLVIIDVKDPAAPKLVVHRNWSPPFQGGTHNAVHLPDRDLLVVVDEAVLDDFEDGFKPIWMFDLRVPSNPVSISTFPQPAEADYRHKGGHYGPHNIHENRPDALVSSERIFATLQNAGIRVYDIRNEYRPEEIAAFVPPRPAKLVDHRPNRPLVIQSCDVYVDKQGLVYANDYNGGLYILETDL
jgi:hypothetical protein